MNGLVLEIGDAKRADVSLQALGTTTSVDVLADAGTVNTSTTEVGSVVSNQQAVDLPLNGRDAMMLVYLLASGAIAKRAARTPESRQTLRPFRPGWPPSS